MNTPSFKLPLKPGVTSTELWLTVAAGLITTLMSVMSLLDVTWAALAITALTLGYNASRSKLKVIQAQTEAHVVKSSIDVEAAKAMASSEVIPPGNVIPFNPHA